MPSDQHVALSIVIPAYNERDRLPPSLEAVRSFVKELGQEVEVIVVDDGSRDGTADLVRETSRGWPALRVVSLERNNGKGAAIRAGFAASRGKCVAYADADLSAPIYQLAALLGDLGDSDVALVSRALP